MSKTKPYLIEKATRTPTIFYTKRAELGVGQRETAECIGLSLTTYAVIEEGVYEISGTVNNPKVQAVAKFYDIPMELADAEAHKNLESGFHPTNRVLEIRSTRTGNSNSRTSSKRSRPMRCIAKDMGVHSEIVDVNPTSKQLELELADINIVNDSTNMEESDMQNNVDLNNTMVKNPLDSTIIAQREIVADAIRCELYGSLEFEKFRAISKLLDQLVRG